MATEVATSPIPTIDHKPHAVFFRQSAWLMMAGIAGGIMTFSVHFLNKGITDAEYSIFITLMMATACIPAMPLQMVFTQQSANALALNREKQLAGMIRFAWFWASAIWLLGAAAVLVFQSAIVRGWGLPNAIGLWVTIPMVLMSLWLPLFSGLLQGRQDFFWLGWTTILGGIARLGGAAAFVFLLHGGAAGMMAGALVGVGLAVGIGIWRTRDLWSQPAEPFGLKNSLGQIVPLMLGFGASQFLFTSDPMFVKAFFSADAMKPYGVAGTLARGILWFVMPMASVMFPKLVHAHARSEKSNLFGIVVMGTGIFAVLGAMCLWLAGPLIIKIMFKSHDVNATMALIPWYAGAMIPLALANVLVNDLLARGRYRVVPFMVLLAIAYGLTLPYVLRHSTEADGFKAALQTLGIFTLLLFGVCALFTWGGKRPQSAVRSPQS